MPNPLFSRYSQGENRVTASTLAVFERISFALVERILQTLCQEQNLSLLTIKNQFKPKNAGSIPDGIIKASLKVFFLSSCEDISHTIHLNQDIRNDLSNAAGKPIAFTMGQRYVSLANLNKNPQTTTELMSG
jgi:hypothetical protein